MHFISVIHNPLVCIFYICKKLCEIFNSFRPTNFHMANYDLSSIKSPKKRNIGLPLVVSNLLCGYTLPVFERNVSCNLVRAMQSSFGIVYCSMQYHDNIHVVAFFVSVDTSTSSADVAEPLSFKDFVNIRRKKEAERRCAQVKKPTKKKQPVAVGIIFYVVFTFCFQTS